MNGIFERYAPVFAAEEAGAGGSANADAGAGSSTPAPVATPESGGGTIEEVDSSSSFDIPDFGQDDLDSIELEPAPASAGSEPVAAPAVKSGGEAAPAAAQPAPVVSAQPAPAQPVASTTAPAEAAPAEASVTLDNVDEMFAQTADGLVDMWANNFTLSEAEIEKLTTNPEEVLPRLLAKAVLMAARSVPNQIKAFVPELVRGHLAQTERSTKAQTAFFSAWPGLEEHSGAVVVALKAAKEQFPNATRAQLIDLGGRMAATMLGLDPNVVGAKQASAVVPNGRGTPPPQARLAAAPFRPAGAGSAANGTGGMPAAAFDADDPWAGFDLPH